jgi:uridine monophosphate synthetase
MLPVDQLESLVLTLNDIGAVRIGRFKLHSGLMSPSYIDLRLLASCPNALREAAAAYRDRLKTLTFDRIAATPLAGLPIGTAICLDMNLPLIYPRKTVKGYGTGKQIEGQWEIGQTVVVVDDLITSGDSLLKGITFLKAAGLRVNEAVVLIDREQGGREALEEQGYRLHSLMTIGQLLAIMESRERITSHQRARILQGLSRG